MKKVLFAVLAVILISVLVLSGCSKETTTTSPSPTPTSTSATPTPTQKYGGTLRILDMRLPAGSVGWPAKMASPDTYFLNPGIETLFRALMDGTLEPVLGTAYKVAPDKSSVTITLRQGVKFQDGTDFNADAAKFNFEAAMAGKVAGTTGWSSVDVIDPYTVKINIAKWENLLLSSLSGIAGMMVSPTAVKTNGEEWAMTNMVTTAPFQLTKFERDTVMEYTKNPNYWQKGKPYLDKIIYTCMPDMVNQVTTYKVGDADLVQPWNGMVLSQLKEMTDSVFIYNDSGVFVIYPDDKNADSPLSKKEVRMAIEYAIDKASLMKVSGFGIFDAAYQVPCRGGIGYIADLPKREFNIAKAKELLTQAGYPNGFETTLTITIPAPDIKDSQVALQTMLAEVGIKCNLEYADPAKYAEYMDKGWHNTMIYSPAYAAGNFLSSVQTYYMLPGFYVSLKGPDNLKELYDAAISTPDVDRAMVDKVTRALYDDCSLIPVSYMGTGQVFKKYVHDTGFGVIYQSQMVWTPENCWMDK